MKTISNSGAQGDVFFRRVDKIPPSYVAQARSGPLVVAHSETGHHHAIDDVQVAHFAAPTDPLVCYLQLAETGGVDVVHHRAWDTHETVRLLGDAGTIYEVRRQREWVPEGWRRVED